MNPGKELGRQELSPKSGMDRIENLFLNQKARSRVHDGPSRNAT